MTPIGIAVSSPPIPTSGAVIEPSTNGSNPSKAEALPAICPWDSIAKENDDVEMTPIEETKKNIGITTVNNGPWKSTARSNNVPEVIDINRPILKNCNSVNNPVNLPTVCVPIISPIPFIPNNKLKAWGDTPKIF